MSGNHDYDPGNIFDLTEHYSAKYTRRANGIIGFVANVSKLITFLCRLSVEAAAGSATPFLRGLIGRNSLLFSLFLSVPVLAFCIQLFEPGFARASAGAWLALLILATLFQIVATGLRESKERVYSGDVGEPNSLWWHLLWRWLPFGMGRNPSFTAVVFEPLLLLVIAKVASKFDGPSSLPGVPAYMLPLSAAIGVFLTSLSAYLQTKSRQNRTLDQEVFQRETAEAHERRSGRSAHRRGEGRVRVRVSGKVRR